LNGPDEELSFPDVPGTSTSFEAMGVVAKEFPFFEKNRVAALVKNGRVHVAYINENGKVGKYYPLLTRIKGTIDYKINPEILKLKNLSAALGKSRRETIQEKLKSISEDINDNQKIIDDPFENQTEKNKARGRMKWQTQEQTSLERELNRLKKGDYSLPSEYIELEAFQKNDEERDKIYQEKEQQKQEKLEIANDENRPSAERESAREDAEKIQKEQNDIENKSKREIDQLPLRDRLREKVKAIFNKYGFTVGAVFLAVGTTIGVVLSSLSNGLKGVSRGVGNGLKTLGKKIAQILPGLIGAVVSFVFRTAGNVVSFLGKHAWLLILAVAAFLFERLMKRRG
jgi:hypothetical protein